MAGVKGRSGGFRVGAGRPRKAESADWLAGDPGKRGPRALARPGTASREVGLGPIAPVTRPVELAGTPAEAVWDRLAPLASAERTLSAATAYAFGWLCKSIAIEQELAVAKPAGANHRGMMQRVEAGLARFRLTPDGKPAEALQPVDVWSEFDVTALTRKPGA